MRLATIDIGTNTAQLLVAEVNEDEEGPKLKRLHVGERFVRLGEGVDANGHINTDAQRRLLHAIQEHVDTARSYNAEEITAVGTSALRDAANRRAVCIRVAREGGIPIETLSGEEEALWSFAAARAPFADQSEPCLVVDIGGGSLELVAGTLDPSAEHPKEAVRGRTSLDLGCVRLTERFFSSHPPAASTVQQLTEHIDGALAPLTLPVGSDAMTIGTAGTATALALVNDGPTSTWDPLDGNGFTLPAATVREWCERLCTLSLDDIRALHPAAMEGRADVFPVGVLLLDRVLQRYDRAACVVSPYELRHGLALRMIHPG